MAWNAKFENLLAYTMESGSELVDGRPFQYFIISEKYLEKFYAGEPLLAGGCGDSECFIADNVPQKFRRPILVHEAVEQRVCPILYSPEQESEMHEYVWGREIQEARDLGMITEYLEFRINNLLLRSEFFRHRGAHSLASSAEKQASVLRLQL